MNGAAAPLEWSARLELFSYAASADSPPPCTGLDLPCVDTGGRLVVESAQSNSGTVVSEDVEQRLVAEASRSFADGRARGIEEGRAAERATQVPEEKHRAEQLRQLLGDFAAERDRYLLAVEHEVVRLALATAARILRREAQTDPLLLMGAVRAALGQVAGATEVRLHVPAADADLWKESIALLPNAPVRPAVVVQSDLRLGECRLEASLGHADLSLRAQLDEIERVLFAPSAALPQSRALMEPLP